MTWLRRLVPAPGLSVALLVLWLLLARGVAPAQVALGLVLALALPPLTRRLRRASSATSWLRTWRSAATCCGCARAGRTRASC